MITDHVYWILELSANADLDDVQTLVDDMVAATKSSEPGALCYEWSLSEDQKVITLYERYQNSEAALTHLANFGEKFAERFMSAFTPQRFTIFGQPDERVKEALASFTPGYTKPLGGFRR